MVRNETTIVHITAIQQTEQRDRWRGFPGRSYSSGQRGEDNRKSGGMRDVKGRKWEEFKRISNHSYMIIRWRTAFL